MAPHFSRYRGIGRLLAVVVLLALPAGAFGECRVVEYPDHNEVVCEDDVPSPQTGQPGRREPSRLETSGQKEFVFHAPVNPVTKLTISVDLSPHAIASPGERLLSYRADVLKDKVYTTTSAAFFYEERTDDTAFTIREEGSGERGGAARATSVTFSDRRNHLLLIPFRSGCSSGAADAIYLKMNRIEGNQLHYQIILPPCLSKHMEQSIAE